MMVSQPLEQCCHNLISTKIAHWDVDGLILFHTFLKTLTMQGVLERVRVGQTLPFAADFLVFTLFLL